MPKLHYLQEVVGNKELLIEHADAIQALLNHTYAASDLEKLRGHEVWSYRLNQKARLLFAMETLGGQSCFVVLEYLPNHEYHKSKFLKSPALLNKYLRSLGDLSFEACVEPLDISGMDVSSAIEWQPVHYYQGQMLTFNSEQERALNIGLPALISGAAGSGKTCIALSLLKAYTGEGRIAYVTHSSALVTKMQKNWEALPQEQHVDFITYQDLLGIREAHASLVGKSEFITWYEALKKHYKQLKKDWVEQYDAELVYQEFRIASGYDIDTYKALGEKQSLISKAYRVEVYDLYQHYLTYLKTSSLQDLAFCELPLAERYTLLVVDEAQDFSHKQLLQLGHLAPGAVVFCMDSHQRLHDRRSIRPFIMKEYQIKEDRHINLMSSYRCPERIVCLSNQLIFLKHRLMGGIGDKYEPSRVLKQSNESFDLGQVFIVSPEILPQNPWVLTQKDTPHLAVITDKAYVEEAKKVFQTPLVFTSEEIKGLEYPIIIAYKLYDTKIFRLIRELDRPEIKQPLYQAKRGEADERFGPHLNQIYTSYTRSQQVLIISEESNRDNEVLLHLLRPFVSGDAPEFEKMSLTVSESNWELEVHKHLSQGNEELAYIIFQSKLGGSRGAFEQLIKPKQSSEPKPILESSCAVEPCLSKPGLKVEELKDMPLETTFSLMAKPGFLPKFIKLNHVRKDHQDLWLTPINIAEYQNIRLVDFLAHEQVANLFFAFVANHSEIMFKLFRQLTPALKKNLSKNLSKSMMHKLERFRKISYDVELFKSKQPYNESQPIEPPLIYAATSSDLNLVKALLEFGAEVNPITPSGSSPLAVAVQFGQIAVFKELIKHTPNYRIENSRGENLGYIAIVFNQPAFLSYLKEKGVVLNKPSNIGILPAYIAAEFRYYPVLSELNKLGVDLNVCDKRGSPITFIPAQTNNTLCLEKLYDFGVDLTKCDFNGNSVAHIAAQHDAINIIKKLAYYKMDLNTFNTKNLTPFMEAACFGSKAVFEFLWSYQKDLYQCSKDGLRVGELAAEMGRVNILEVLLVRGYDFLKRNQSYEIPESFACKFGQISVIEFLHKHGLLQLNTKTVEVLPCIYALMGNQKNILEFYHKNWFDFHQRTTEGFSLASFAAESGAIDSIKFLRKLGLDLKNREPNGYMLTHFAAKKGRVQLLHYLNDIDIDLSETTSDGENIVSLAVLYQQFEILNFAHRYMIDFNLKSHAHTTPLEAALMRNDLSMAHKVYEYCDKKLIKQQMLSNDFCRGIILGHLSFLEFFKDKFNFDQKMTVNLDDPLFKLENKPCDLASSVTFDSKALVAKLQCLFRTDDIELGLKAQLIEMTPLALAELSESVELIELVKTYLLSPQQCFFAILAQEKESLPISMPKDFDYNLPMFVGKSAFFLAIQTNFSMFEQVLELGGDINAVMPNGETVVFAAIDAENVKIIQKLRAMGANFNLIRHDGHTPLSLAVLRNPAIFNELRHCGVHPQNESFALAIGIRQERYDILDYFLDAGVDFNAIDWSKIDITSFFEKGLSPTMLEYLHGIAKMKLSFDTQIGKTLIINAVKSGDIKTINKLGQIGVNFNIPIQDTEPLALLAVKKPNHGLIASLIQNKLNFNVVAQNGLTTPLSFLVQKKNIDTIKFILSFKVINVNQESKKGETVAHLAADMGDISLIRLLHKAGVLYDKMDSQLRCGTAMELAVFKNNTQVVREFCSYGINPYLKAHKGQSPFKLAVFLGKMEALRVFFECGVPLEQMYVNKADCGLLEMIKGEAIRTFELFSEYKVNFNRLDYPQPLIFSAVQYSRSRVVKFLIHKVDDILQPVELNKIWLDEFIKNVDGGIKQRFLKLMQTKYKVSVLSKIPENFILNAHELAKIIGQVDIMNMMDQRKTILEAHSAAKQGLFKASAGSVKQLECPCIP